ncbi:MAG: fumarylacetoacetate hydrolase family protein [Pseudomonadota bacterium]
MNKADEIAHEIRAQHRARRRFYALTGGLAPGDLDEAYAAQFALHRLEERGGRGPLGGRKIALASKVQQELCGIDHPIAGGIYAPEIYESPAEIALAAYHGLGVEFELAVEIGRDITGPGHDVESIRSHITGLRPAFELIIDRDANYETLDARTMIADNAWCAGVILGDPIPDWQDLDLAALPCRLEWSGEDPAEAVTGDADPLGSLAWVANLVTGQGEKIRAGEIVITGSVIKTRYPKGAVSARYQINESAVELSIR